MHKMTVLIWLFPLIFISSCSNTQPISTTVQKQYPPKSLLQDCPAPASVGNTYRDILKWLNSYKHALKKCNADKKALRDWAIDKGT